MTIVCKWDFGKKLYLVTDPDQRPRFFTGVMRRPSGTMYELVSGSAGSWHYDFEIAEEPDTVTKLAGHGA